MTRLWRVGALMAVVTGCPLPGVDNTTFQCGSTQDCAPGWECVAGTCAQPGHGVGSSSGPNSLGSSNASSSQATSNTGSGSRPSSSTAAGSSGTGSSSSAPSTSVTASSSSLTTTSSAVTVSSTSAGTSSPGGSSSLQASSSASLDPSSSAGSSSSVGGSSSLALSSSLQPGSSSAGGSSSSGGGPWWDPTWTARMRVDLNTSSAVLGGTLADVPVLVTIPAGSPLYAVSQNYGEDLRFVAADHSTVLPHEKDNFNKSSDSLIWVTVPVVTPDTPLHFWIYTNSPGAVDAQLPAQVWTSSFAGVWHGNTGVPNPAPVFTESAAARDLVGVNMDIFVRATGRLGQSIPLDGVDDYAQATGTGNLNAFANGAMTLSAWVNVNVPDGVVVGKRFGGNNQYSLRVETANQFVTFSRDDTNGDACRWRSDSGFAVRQWHHVAATVNANGTPIEFYVDGSPTGTTQVNNNCNATWRTNAVDLTVGGVATSNNPPYTDLFDGAVDEVRVERVARNAAWMRYQYLSMTNALVTLGMVENY